MECKYATQKGFCSNYWINIKCAYKHPPECKNKGQCFAEDCKYVHPNDKCTFGVDCNKFGCGYRHPKGRTRECKDDKTCTRPKCTFLHSAKVSVQQQPIIEKPLIPKQIQKVCGHTYVHEQTCIRHLHDDEIFSPKCH